MKKILFITSCFLLIASSAWARIYIPVDQPSDKTALYSHYRNGPTGRDRLREQGGEGHTFDHQERYESRYFEVISDSAFLDRSEALTADSIDFSVGRPSRPEPLLRDQ